MAEKEGVEDFRILTAHLF